jgi:hypothetical protein
MTFSARRSVSPLQFFLAAIALILVFLAIANFSGSGGNGGTGPYIITATISVMVAALLLFWALPRADNRPRWALVFGILAVLLVAVFWSGLAFAFGTAAVALGLAEQQRRSGQSTAAIVLGGLAVVVAAILCVVS